MAEETKTPAPSSGQKNVGMAVLCYFGILVLIPFLTDAKNDPFVKFHIKQGLILLIAGVIAGVVSWIPFVGWILGIFVFVLFIIGIVNAASGKEARLPIIGQLGEGFKI